MMNNFSGAVFRRKPGTPATKVNFLNVNIFMSKQKFTFVPQGGQQLLNVGMSYELMFANTCLGKRKVTFNPKQTRTLPFSVCN